MSIFIKNGTVYDGSGDHPQQKNVLVEGDKITAVTEREDIDADQVIEARGLTVTPGFIDTHRHCDIDALYRPDFGTIELAQGLTAIIGGNCGLAPIPAPKAHRKEIFDFIEPCLGAAPEQLQMEHYHEYIEALEARELPLHVGSYIGAGALKAAIKGYGKSAFTQSEMEQAKAYIREGMEAGAVGLSMGLMYQPECYSSREELVALASCAAPFGRPLTCHIRGEGDNLISSVKEITEIAKQAGVPLNISHFKATGVKNWGKAIHQAIDLVEAARSSGQDITVDFYPYCGGSTTLISLLPPSVMGESIEQTLDQLAAVGGKELLRRELYREHSGWDNMALAIGWERILISSVNRESNRKYAGKSFKEAAGLAGYEEPSDFVCDLLVQEQGKVSIIVLSMSQEDVDTVARLPYSMVISDSLYGPGDCPHPRLYGSFPKIIREYVLERSVLSMEEAIRKMTLLPAKRLSLKGRGMLREGYHADINLFHAEQLRDYAVYDNPRRLCTGIQTSIIDGRIAVSQGEIRSRNCGSVIKL
jgi:N-acyl-D-amino-acid deacylase